MPRSLLKSAVECVGQYVPDYEERCATRRQSKNLITVKYQPVLDAIQKEGAQLQNVNLDGNQLYLKATATSEASKDRIWDAIKRVDLSPTFERMLKSVQF